VHDVFVGLPDALRRYEERGSLAAWLKRVTVDCWRVEEREGNDKSMLWVSKDHGWLVMTRHTSSDGSGKWRTEWVNETHLVAVDTLPTPPTP
jgi:hypothetical protein